jgi:hypothetical protein
MTNLMMQQIQHRQSQLLKSLMIHQKLENHIQKLITTHKNRLIHSFFTSHVFLPPYLQCLRVLLLPIFNNNGRDFPMVLCIPIHKIFFIQIYFSTFIQ